MYSDYREQLEKEIQRAEEQFEEAKKNAIRDILNMDAMRASEYGAANSSEIAKITSYASKVMALKYQLQAYDYFNQKEDAKNE